MLVEVCVDDAAGLRAAVAGGADRIELCSVLELGGLSPGAGLMAQAGECGVPARAMIRPRPGGFVWDADEIETMLREIDAARAAGIAGVVLGAATPQGQLDHDTLRRLVSRAQGMAVTLHRVIDVLEDPLAAVDHAAELGFDTILTSGGAPTAWEGADMVGAMVRHAAGRLTIMAGSGVTAQNAADLVRRTGVRALHGSCRMAREALVPTSAREQALGFGTAPQRVTSAQCVAALVAAAQASAV